MALNVYTLDESEKWDEIVHTFKEFDVYYLSGYVKAFQNYGDGKAYLLYYTSDYCRGIHVVMKRDISEDKNFMGMIEENQFFDVATPYGYGGWLIEGEKGKDKLFEEYTAWCKKNRIISEFVRYHPVLNNERYTSDGYNVFSLGSTVCMDISSKNSIWNNLTSKNRNMIRKAVKSGIKIYNGNYPEIYTKFREIYNATMDKDNAEQYYYFNKEFYQSILEDLSKNAQVFFAELEGKIIAVSIILFANKKANYHLSGSIKEYQHLAPTNLLLYKVALWGNENGYKTFHLGGGVGAREDGLYKFKKAFYRGEPRIFHIGKKIFDEDVYNQLVTVRKQSNDEMKEGFFPEYRA